MPSSEADRPEAPGWGLDELGLLAALGFGPESGLMNEPKLFVDAPFLAALQVELAQELGEAGARAALFQIGVLHGLRDAARLAEAAPAEGRPTSVECPPLAMRFGSRRRGSQGLEIPGVWPERHEAEAHLAKRGTAHGPACVLSAGYTSGWLSGNLDIEVIALETGCAAAGAERCTFLAREAEAWRDGACAPAEAARVVELLGPLSLASLRSVATRGPDPASTSDASSAAMLLSPRERMPNLPGAFDPDDPAVHVWGPVMVMPFAGSDAAIETLELLASDSGMQQVRAVVIDLCGHVVDEGLGAAGLESLIASFEERGAEVVLTGISPLSEPALADLDASAPVLCRKDLPEAVAYAFQIAEAQRHML